MVSLKLNIKLLEHPYKDEASSAGEIWSEIRLVIINEQGQLIKEILKWQWDINVFLEWVDINTHALIHDECPIPISGSIAYSIFVFHDQLDIDVVTDAMMDAVYDYRHSHAIRFALRGTDIPDIYIGKAGETMTVSFYGTETDQWCFDISIDEFLEDCQNARRQILGERKRR